MPKRAMLMVMMPYRLTNVKFNATDPLNPTEFERERSINYNNLHSIISIVENYNGQTRTIDTEIRKVPITLN